MPLRHRHRRLGPMTILRSVALWDGSRSSDGVRPRLPANLALGAPSPCKPPRPGERAAVKPEALALIENGADFWRLLILSDGMCDGGATPYRIPKLNRPGAAGSGRSSAAGGSADRLCGAQSAVWRVRQDRQRSARSHWPALRRREDDQRTPPDRRQQQRQILLRSKCWPTTLARHLSI
jgi:hypothetical protein